MTTQLSGDSQAIALACSSVAAMGGSQRPLSPTDWSKLSVSIHGAGLRPRNLLEMSRDDLENELGLAPQPAERLTDLLSRGGQLALEVERLASRGIWILTRADDAYPSLLRERLGSTSPPVLFGAGPLASLRLAALAVVGSRDVSEEGSEFAERLGAATAEQGLAVVSGAARGVDSIAMAGAISRGGTAIGVTVDPLERLIKRSELRSAIAEESLTLLTPFHPAARWHQGNAMRRNRLIYVLSQAAVVVATGAGKGGTWSGAIENLKAGWVPLHVREDGSEGSRQLIAAGATGLASVSPQRLDLRKLAERSQSSLLDEKPAPALGDSGSNPASPDEDVFEAAWPLLAAALAEPRTEKELATRLDLQLTQARAWLRRAIAEDRVRVTKRPKRYVRSDTTDGQLQIGA